MSFKIGKMYDNFIISGPILIIKLSLFSVYRTAYHTANIRLIHAVFKDFLRQPVSQCFIISSH